MKQTRAASQTAATLALEDNKFAMLRLRQWRDATGIPAWRAAKLLGIPRRTLEHIEQGRGFRYPLLLMLAIEAAEARHRKMEAAMEKDGNV